MVSAPRMRRSWAWCIEEIIDPAHMNSNALNRAWVERWNRARDGRARPRLAIITPSWLRVDRAIIFFMSDSNIADSPAINIVRDAVRSKRVWKFFVIESAG